MTEPQQIAAAVIPPHRGAGPIAPAQLRIARVRVAIEMLSQVVQDLEAAPLKVREAVCRALEATLELQATLRATP